ncbi:MAG: universal stress protein [Streptococcaceae bacterium]|jgi:nucleotide-binding universal stress UspA family protein|nr:universal stress protein [Streptococcaceae bacterium]
MLQEYKHILVAVDGSKEAEKAFNKAINNSKRNQAKLTIAHIIDTRAFQTVSSFDGILAEQATKIAEDTLKKHEEKAKKEGCKDVKTIIEYGSPKLIIAKQIPSEENIDLIMLGATGLNAVERLFIGSVSEYVIRHAQCDILIVRTDDATLY